MLTDQQLIALRAAIVADATAGPMLAAGDIFSLHLHMQSAAGKALLIAAGVATTRSHLITERGVISALGPVVGEALLQGLYGFGSMTLPAGPLAAAQPGIARVIGWLRPPADGVDLGDPLTGQLLRTMAAAGVPGVTSAAVEALLAIPVVAGGVSVDDLNKLPHLGA